MNKAMGDMLENASVRKRLEDLGLEIVPPERRSPEYLAKFLPEEIERWGRIIRAAGISAD
jgi:tripartite-type tricarboxylate transporter receptor subunit TctC